MKSILIFTLFFTSLFSNAERGQELYNQAKCYECHDPSEFTSKQRRAKNYKQLIKNVEACRFKTNADWFDEDKDDVVDFLNKAYYKYDIKK